MRRHPFREIFMLERRANLDKLPWRNELNETQEYSALGMGRPIARRDFLNGLAIGITGAYASLSGMTVDPSALV
jgi:hypothetical protein